MTRDFLTYEYKKILSKELQNFGDEDFKYQVVLNAKKPLFTEYDWRLFQRQIRNINLQLNKAIKKNKITSLNSIKNSIHFLYINYNESFIDSIIGHYFHSTAKDTRKQEILNNIVITIWEDLL